MSYFQNRNVNWIYLHTSLSSFAEFSGGIFVQAYLLSKGFSFSAVMVIYALFMMGRFFSRLALMPFVRQFGLRAGLIGGVFFIAMSYIPLALTNDVGLMLIAYLISIAIGEGWYWTSYHAITAQLGDNEKRGRQTSAVQLIYALNFVAAPLIGGYALGLFGPIAGFGLAAIVMMLSLAPLLKLPSLPHMTESHLEPKARRFAWQAFAADGFAGALGTITARVVLFALLGQSFQLFGSTIAFAALFGAVLGLILGRKIDFGHGKSATAFAVGLGSFDIIFKAVAATSPKLMVAAQAFGAVVSPVYGSAFMSRAYRIGKASGDPLRFQGISEGGWDIGAATGALCVALLSSYGLGLGWIILLGLIGTIATMIILDRSFKFDVPQSD